MFPSLGLVSPGAGVIDTFTVSDPYPGWDVADSFYFNNVKESLVIASVAAPISATASFLVLRGPSNFYTVETFGNNSTAFITEALTKFQPYPSSGAWPDPSLSISVFDQRQGSLSMGSAYTTWTVTSIEVVKANPVPESSAYTLSAAALLGILVLCRRGASSRKPKNIES